MERAPLAIGLFAVFGYQVACGSTNDVADSAPAPVATDAGPREGEPGFGVVEDAGRSDARAVLPTSFVPGEFGGYALGQAIDGDGVTDTGAPLQNADGTCSVVVGVVRDFKGHEEPGGHPDFEAFSGNGVTFGLVAANLGDDRKPIYAATTPSMTTSKERFDQWFRFTPNVNKPYLVYFQFVPNGAVSTFESSQYFPLDDAGWGADGPGKDYGHNFGFTTELHTTFHYGGGERFDFLGDDDVFVFINGKLAVDLGGPHAAAPGSIELDARAADLGITKGQSYSLDLFHAERKSSRSSFRIDTNLAFTTCGVVPPDRGPK